MFEGLVTTLNLFYSLNEPYATVRFSGDNDSGLLFVVMHQSFMFQEDFITKEREVKTTVDLYEFFGSEASPRFDVEDKDVLIVLAKRHDTIVASQVFEVDFSATARGYLLLPRGGYNLLCDQNELEQVECDQQKERPTIPVCASLLPWYAGMDEYEEARQELGF